ncbi:MAG: type II toxin-antitoxin system VapC family toxin [Verrucomicrobiales bacterium]|jgi:predicted nucleic acid-binding protein|nr:type II toxin-antitoxin system VapC family toxin [Verrucomicrobiales bacterium]
MIWVVDTCVVIDLLVNDEEFGERSGALLEARWAEGLGICPVTQVELAPAFEGSLAKQKRFLDLAGIDYDGNWEAGDTMVAHQAWQSHVRSRRAGLLAKRPIADVFIGAFASSRRGLITRNAKDFRQNFPDLEILEP